MSLSVAVIDRACRNGQDVRVGNERIAGAVSSHRVGGISEPAEPGHVWVDVLPDYEWRHVRLSDVTIFPSEGASMETVTNLKQRRGRGAANLGAGAKEPTEGSDVVDQEPDGQKRLEGMERVADKEIEDLAWGVHGLQN